MNRYIRLPADNPTRQIDFDLVEAVSYVYEDGRRLIRCRYRNGSTVDAPLSQGPDMYREAQDVAGCDFPCFYRRECDSAPTSPACMDCALLEILTAHSYDPRPVPLRLSPRRGDWRTAAIVVLAGLLLAALATGAQERQSSPLSDGKPGQKVSR